MNVLVLGGTGAMGAHVTELLAEKGAKVCVTSRKERINSDSIVYVCGNAKDRGFMNSLLEKKWDVIVDFMVYTTVEFERCVEQMLAATGHYIYLSSARVYAHSDLPLSEESPRLLDSSSDETYLRTDEYALTKARQENLLFASTRKNWSIIRPYITYSNQRLQLGVLEKEDWLYRALGKRTIAASRDTNAKLTTLTHGRDVARGICALLGQESAMGETFHITGNEPIAWSEVLTIYTNVLESKLGRRPHVVLQSLEEFMRWRKGRYQIIYDRLYNRVFDNSKIAKYIDPSSFVAPKTGLKQCLESFMDATLPEFNSINWRAEGTKDGMLGERTPLGEIPHIKNKLKYFLFRNIVSKQNS